jgi:CBS domain containing-hemolysin-like protein
VLGRLLVIAVLLLMNGFFVGVEFALVRSRRTRLEAMARAGDGLSRLALRAMDNIGRLLSATQIGITLVSLALGALAEESLAHFFREWLGSWPAIARISTSLALGSVLAISIVSYFHVVFGELAPKSLALVHPERMARILAPPLMLFEFLMRPFAVVLTKSAQMVLAVFGVKGASMEESFHSPEELMMLVEQSEEGGAIEKTDATLIEGVFEFSEKNAREVMTPRTEIDSLEVGASLEDAVALVEETRRSRYPVFDESIDNIVGLVLAKDLIPVLRRPPVKFDLRALMRPIHVVPGSREVEEVLSDFKRLNQHLAIVLDEYGGTAGLVTMEDLLEEIVGEIRDEKDEPPEAEEREAPHLVLLPGSTAITDVNERHGLTVPDEDYTTIGGYVFGTLGRLPSVGDRVTVNGAVFTVREMEGRRIETLAVDLKGAKAAL